MNYSKALEHIKKGERCHRTGWNGKDMFVFLVAGSTFKVNREPLLSFYKVNTELCYRPHIDMRYADGSIGVWLASHGDMMGEDWFIYSDTPVSTTVNVTGVQGELAGGL